MTVWFTSDTHWGHENVIKFSNRPYSSVEEMNESLIESWNKCVKRGDRIYHLGDFSFGNGKFTKDVLSRLNGEKHFVEGNHDRQMWSQRDFFQSYDQLKEITVEDQKIILCHYSMRVWNKSHYGAWMLYGHSHGTLPMWGKSLDVGTDSSHTLGYPALRPVSFEEIKVVLDKQEISIVDQHVMRRNA